MESGAFDGGNKDWIIDKRRARGGGGQTNEWMIQFVPQNVKLGNGIWVAVYDEEVVAGGFVRMGFGLSG